jgi:hypothetical protein
MKPEQPTGPGVTPGRDPDRGEGDRVSARPYNKQVEAELDDAARAERKARRGPHPTKVSLDELVDMGRTVVDRVRPYVERGVGRLRARFHRK